MIILYLEDSGLSEGSSNEWAIGLIGWESEKMSSNQSAER